MKPAPVLNSSSVATLLSSSWKKLSFFLLLIFPVIFLAAQDTTATLTGPVSASQLNSHASEKFNHSPNKKRVLLITGINVAGYGSSLIALNSAWYKGYAKTTFHTFDDSREWLQVDKAGHAWGAYNASRGTTAMWDWAGLPHKKAVWIGGLSSMAYLTTIEFMDAYSAKWGWSWSDIGANIFGSGLFMGQEFLWNELRIQYKFSFHHKDYGEQQLEQRADNLFGKPWYERMLKDYNAQTYWLSFNLKSFLKDSNLPAWLNVSFGYGADGMLGGFENKWTDDADNEISRTDIPRKRQFYLAPDIDFTKIKTNSRFLKTTFAVLNSFKFPAPALMLDNKGKFKAYAIYF
ncbi:DUF2279 domain-containing protein [Terrimonas alba]|uniref:DUF2279 domain-containing protein n=1 Tax=Terrimonas alba TaxID=3349636 RepID=UPI0035F32349